MADYLNRTRATLAADFARATAATLAPAVTPLHIEALRCASIRGRLWRDPCPALAARRREVTADLYRWAAIRRRINGTPQHNLAPKVRRKYKIVRGGSKQLSVVIELTDIGAALLVASR